MPPVARALRTWNSLSIERQFFLAATAAVGLSMLTLGYWVEKRVRAGWTQAMAETGATYLESLLAPFIDGVDPETGLSPESGEKIRNLLTDTKLGRRVAKIKLWSRDGRLIFSTNPSDPPSRLDEADLRRVRDGQVIVDTNDDDHSGSAPSPPNSLLIEVYAPIYAPRTREVAAIGEFYEYSESLNQEIASVRYTTWLLILNVALVIVVLLHVIVKRASRMIASQQALLETNLARAAGLAKRNDVLRRRADRERRNAALLNENYLSNIGADIHDGPIQILSLMMLKLPDADQPDEASLRRALADTRGDLSSLIQQALVELRNLSAGLVLPEVEDLTTAGTIELAIARHEQQTGTRVKRDIPPLGPPAPTAVRVCCYRVVQEALTNGYKHAGGRGQSVSALVEGETLTVVVEDEGLGPAVQPNAKLGGSRLGLRGMETRVRALRGSISINDRQEGGVRVVARLPLNR
ncbi:histidine kinase [Alsobacter metallidurans]|uniref:histidine kinase n=2 Tax=Alsobacter metallidurans TaxID=340221 RepID=A0A917MI74_9HYPH|nr:histidine kinase [Alsobacter metallidurans]